MGLELLVASDTIRTVALDTTLINIATLGGLVLVRTFLGWTPTIKVVISAGGFIQPGDKAAYWIDPATHIPCRFEFHSELDGEPVSGQVEFGQVQGGPQYVAQLSVKVPGKEVAAKIENFNYQRQ